MEATRTLPDLPPELLLLISSFLPPVNSLALSCTCKKIHRDLSETPSFWKRVCRDLDLFGEEWNEDNGSNNKNTLSDLKGRFLRGKRAERGLRRKGDLRAQRINFDINAQRSVKFFVIKNQRIQTFPEEAGLRLDLKTLKQSHIAQNVFSCDISDRYFVLIISDTETFKSRVTVWKVGKEISFAYGLTPNTHPDHELVNFWLFSAEDMRVHKNLLILMATKVEPSPFFNESRPINSELLHIYNLDREPSSPSFLVARYSLPPPWLRLVPQVLKAGGGLRLSVWDDMLLAVCPLVKEGYYRHGLEKDQAKLEMKVFRLPSTAATEQLAKELHPLWEHTVQQTCPLLPISYMACDQKAAHMVLAFSKLPLDPGFPLTQQFITLTLKEDGIETIAVHTNRTMPKVCQRFFYKNHHKKIIQKIFYNKVPSLLVGEDRRREECLVAVGEKPHQFAVMDAAGLVTVHSDGKFVQFFPIYGICDNFDTNYDELHIYRGKLVMLKIFQNRELGLGEKHSVLAVASLEGQLLWRVNTTLVNNLT